MNAVAIVVLLTLIAMIALAIYQRRQELKNDARQMEQAAKNYVEQKAEAVEDFAKQEVNQARRTASNMARKIGDEARKL